MSYIPSTTAKYTVADPTLTDGQSTSLRADQTGALLMNNVKNGAGEDFNNQVFGVIDKPVASALYSPNRYQSPSTAVLLANIKNATGAIQSIYVTNASAALVWFQIHNLNSTPAGGNTANYWWPVPAGTANNPGVLSLSKAQLGGIINCQVGIGFSISTAKTTVVQTGLTAADYYEDISYV